MISSTTPAILEVAGVTKVFPGVRALDDVSWAVAPGEVHALVGENGAGKSSLVKVVSGLYAPDAGTMTFGGLPYAPASPEDGLAVGIRVVHQELTLLPYLSVAENICLEALPRKRGLLDRRALERRSGELLERVGLAVSPSTLVEQLGIAQMQLVEIAKALAGDSRLLILDEPTATLTPTEVETLFSIIRRLREGGVAVVFISHHLDEVFALADRVTVMRNGVVASTHPIAEVDQPGLVRAMIGRGLDLEGLGAPAAHGEGVALEVSGLRTAGNPHAISFQVREGEILGIAGLMGSGRTEVLRAIFGADRRDAGDIRVHGRDVDIRTPRDAVRHGISLVTEDRKGQGLMLELSCAANVSITDLRPVTRGGLLRKSREHEIAERLRAQLGVRTPSMATAVGSLSGGNQQKVVLAKWLHRGADVLMVDEPTRGIDVGAKFEIYGLLRALAAEGRAVVVVSSELPELRTLCHRIAVLSRGQLAGELDRRDFDDEQILQLAYRHYVSTGPTMDVTT